MSDSYISPSLDHGAVDLSGVNGVVLGLNITKSVDGFVKQNGEAALTAANIMGFIQRAWRLNKIRASKAQLIFACYHTEDNRRKIIGVFTSGRKLIEDVVNGDEGLTHEVKKLDQFIESDEDHRFIFLAEPCEPREWNKYVNRYLPAPQKGEANPVRYYNDPR